MPTIEAKFRVVKATGNMAYVTYGDHHRYCVVWDYRRARDEWEFSLWSPEGRKVTSLHRRGLTPEVREAMKSATVADIERMGRVRRLEQHGV
jgi:hypothetical protein